jgi:beta-N-acetylhexosaminidase
MNPIAQTAIVSMGVISPTVFQQELSRGYPNSRIFMVDKKASATDLNGLYEALKQYSQVYISINDTRLRPQSKLDYSTDVKQFITQLATKKNTVISVFANAYTMAGLPGLEKAGALLVCYQMTDDLQLSAVKVITQQLKPTGKLPVSVNEFFPGGMGVLLQ